MARKAIDYWPTVTLKPEVRGPLTKQQAQRIADEIVELVLRHVTPHVSESLNVRSFGKWEVETSIEEDARCEHCNHVWTEEGPDYNGGCCALDAQLTPEGAR